VNQGFGDGWPADRIAPRSRVLTDNDYGGDPDGLVELAQLLLSPSVEVAGVIGSRLRAGDDWEPLPDSAVTAATEIVALTGRAGDVPVHAGSNQPLDDHSTPVPSAAVDAIVAEAMRDDTELPLYVTCGAGLTQIASAWLTEPRIGRRLTLIWIGGSEHEGHAPPPPGEGPLEYNLSIDPIAAEVVFDDSDLDVWQVPRNVYRQVVASRAELLFRMRPCGPLGRHLYDTLGSVAGMAAGHGFRLGEVYILGDSPLVLLTALQSSFHPAPSSSTWVTMPCPRLLDSGAYEPRPGGRPLRVFTTVDTRLLLEDLYAKLAVHAGHVVPAVRSSEAG
jgi:inosine-uridine nucleoside N-ribohydrolase